MKLKTAAVILCFILAINLLFYIYNLLEPEFTEIVIYANKTLNILFNIAELCFFLIFAINIKSKKS